MWTTEIRPGDLVIYRKTKHSRTPGPRAANIHPAANGDTYVYTVDKYWIVKDILPDGSVLAETRRGKQHTIEADDPQLKRANWLHRILYHSRFAELVERFREGLESESSTPQSQHSADNRTASIS